MNRKRIALTLFMAFLGEIANKVVPLVNLHVVASRLGVEAFGLAQYALWLLEWGIVFTTFGFAQLGPAMLRDAKSGHEERLVNGSVIVARFFLALVAVLVFVIAVQTTEQLVVYRTAVYSSLFIVLASAFESVWILAAKQKLAVLSMISMVVKILSILAVFLMVNDRDDAVLFVIITNTVNATIAIASFVVARNMVGFAWPSKHEVLSALKKSTPFALAILVFMLVDRFDLYLVENYFGTAATGLYSSASKLIGSVTPIIASTSAVFYSEMLAHSDTATIESLLKSSLFWVLSLIAPISGVMILFGKEILTIIFGPEYSAAADILSVLSFGTLFFTAIIVFGFQLLAIKRRWLPLVIALVSGLILGAAGGYTSILSAQLSGIALAAVLAKSVAALILIASAISLWKIRFRSVLLGFFWPLLPTLLLALLVTLVMRWGLMPSSPLVMIFLLAAAYLALFISLNIREARILSQKIYSHFLG